MDIRDSLLGNAKAVIFDMDGVLVDSEPFWAMAEKEVFTGLGAILTEADCKLTRSMTTLEVTQYWYGKFPWEPYHPLQVGELVIDKVIELIQINDCCIKGIKPFIENLKVRGLKVGLATNAPERVIPGVLHKQGVSHLFDAICSAESESKGKPHPAVYLKTARQLGIDPSQCIAVEDSLSGITAAKAAGMAVIGFTNNNRDLVFEISDSIIHDFAEL